MNPKNILLIKAHSMGIGDLLRSSAAWSALKTKWPNARLHLLMLSKHQGYPSESFIRSHQLLTSAHFVTVKRGEPGQSKQVSVPISDIYAAVDASLKTQDIDLVIDFESGGIKTSLISRWIAKRKKAVSVGIAQFPLRKYFYDLTSPSVPRFTALNKFKLPMDYTERDFVVLAALGISRAGAKITLLPPKDGMEWMQAHPVRIAGGKKIVVLNIGCGTPDAASKRPALEHLAACCSALYSKLPFQLHLSGATFEKDINSDFAKLFAFQLSQAGLVADIVDWSGQLSLDELTGLLAQADLVVSSDSGPYHIAVALGVPTLCWFNFDTPASYHRQPGVQCLIQPTPDQFATAGVQLVSYSSNG
jgi:ADP-heptose:LPS heptosyltransferase